MSDSNDPFVPAEISRQAEIHLEGSPEDVFPLFGPIRESDWADGWSPVSISAEAEPMREGFVFRTEHEGATAFWVLVDYDEKQGRVQYVVTSPTSHVARIRIALTPDGPGHARAHIRYDFTGLTGQGNAYIERHTPSYFTSWVGDWQEAINHYLRTGRKLVAGKSDQAHH